MIEALRFVENLKSESGHDEAGQVTAATEWSDWKV